jgi:hypothetical protein
MCGKVIATSQPFICVQFEKPRLLLEKLRWEYPPKISIPGSNLLWADASEEKTITRAQRESFPTENLLETAIFWIENIRRVAISFASSLLKFMEQVI